MALANAGDVFDHARCSVAKRQEVDVIGGPPGRLENSVANVLIGGSEQATTGVVDDHDLAGVERVRRQHQRPYDVVGDAMGTDIIGRLIGRRDRARPQVTVEPQLPFGRWSGVAPIQRAPSL